jgi:hypothetical protein
MSGMRKRAVPLNDGIRRFLSRARATRSPSFPAREASRCRIRASARSTTSCADIPSSAARSSASANAASRCDISARTAVRKSSYGSYRYSRAYATTPVWVTAQVLPALVKKPFPLR